MDHGELCQEATPPPLALVLIIQNVLELMGSQRKPDSLKHVQQHRHSSREPRIGTEVPNNQFVAAGISS